MTQNGSLQNGVETAVSSLQTMAKQAGQGAKHYLDEASGKAIQMRDALESQVQANPFKSIGIAFAGGALLGLLMRKRR